MNEKMVIKAANRRGVKYTLNTKIATNEMRDEYEKLLYLVHDLDETSIRFSRAGKGSIERKLIAAKKAALQAQGLVKQAQLELERSL